MQNYGELVRGRATRPTEIVGIVVGRSLHGFGVVLVEHHLHGLLGIIFDSLLVGFINKNIDMTRSSGRNFLPHPYPKCHFALPLLLAFASKWHI